MTVPPSATDHPAEPPATPAAPVEDKSPAAPAKEVYEPVPAAQDAPQDAPSEATDNAPSNIPDDGPADDVSDAPQENSSLLPTPSIIEAPYDTVPVETIVPKKVADVAALPAEEAVPVDIEAAPVLGPVPGKTIVEPATPDAESAPVPELIPPTLERDLSPAPGGDAWKSEIDASAQRPVPLFSLKSSAVAPRPKKMLQVTSKRESTSAIRRANYEIRSTSDARIVPAGAQATRTSTRAPLPHPPLTKIDSKPGFGWSNQPTFHFGDVWRNVSDDFIVATDR